MGILSSLYTGVTGLQGQGEALAIYGDNIANANTVGFKTSRPEFSDVVAKSLKGLLGGNQIGRGTKLAAVNPVFAQGSVIQTESSTDLAISGDGFFVMKGIDGQSFSRNGAFHFDKDGKLINADGYRVQGFMADDMGKITSKMGDIGVERTVVDAHGTKELSIYANLDSRPRMDENGNVTQIEFDPERPDRTSDWATGATIYDKAGAPHVVTIYFNRGEGGAWTYRVMAKGEEVQDGAPGKMVMQASGQLRFDGEGRLAEHAPAENSFNFKNSEPGQQIELNFGAPRLTGGDGLQVTSFGTASEAYKTLQDGYTAGTLSGLTFNDDGTLTAVYSNGQNINLAQVALGKFENPEGLFKMGQNRYRESRLSGQPTIGAPTTGGRGSITPKSIESSTTDIANEFINLMTAQRNFQANARVVNVGDEMLKDVINLGRG